MDARPRIAHDPTLDEFTPETASEKTAPTPPVKSNNIVGEFKVSSHPETPDDVLMVSSLLYVGRSDRDENSTQVTALDLSKDYPRIRLQKSENGEQTDTLQQIAVQLPEGIHHGTAERIAGDTLQIVATKSHPDDQMIQSHLVINTDLPPRSVETHTRKPMYVNAESATITSTTKTEPTGKPPTTMESTTLPPRTSTLAVDLEEEQHEDEEATPTFRLGRPKVANPHPLGRPPGRNLPPNVFLVTRSKQTKKQNNERLPARDTNSERFQLDEVEKENSEVTEDAELEDEFLNEENQKDTFSEIIDDEEDVSQESEDEETATPVESEEDKAARLEERRQRYEARRARRLERQRQRALQAQANQGNGPVPLRAQTESSRGQETRHSRTGDNLRLPVGSGILGNRFRRTNQRHLPKIGIGYPELDRQYYNQGRYLEQNPVPGPHAATYNRQGYPEHTGNDYQYLGRSGFSSRNSYQIDDAERVPPEYAIGSVPSASVLSNQPQRATVLDRQQDQYSRSYSLGEKSREDIQNQQYVFDPSYERSSDLNNRRYPAEFDTYRGSLPRSGFREGDDFYADPYQLPPDNIAAGRARFGTGSGFSYPRAVQNRGRAYDQTYSRGRNYSPQYADPPDRFPEQRFGLQRVKGTRHVSPDVSDPGRISRYPDSRKYFRGGPPPLPSQPFGLAKVSGGRLIPEEAEAEGSYSDYDDYSEYSPRGGPKPPSFAHREHGLIKVEGTAGKNRKDKEDDNKNAEEEDYSYEDPPRDRNYAFDRFPPHSFRPPPRYSDDGSRGFPRRRVSQYQIPFRQPYARPSYA